MCLGAAKPELKPVRPGAHALQQKKDSKEGPVPPAREQPPLVRTRESPVAANVKSVHEHFLERACRGPWRPCGQDAAEGPASSPVELNLAGCTAGHAPPKKPGDSDTCTPTVMASLL